MSNNIKITDPEVATLIAAEEVRQKEVLEMIPSENYASQAVREAVGSVLINKYSEGQVAHRYYQGNAVIDQVEALCKKRALSLFGVQNGEWGVNVQPYSGSPANLAVIAALVEPGETIMVMYLPDGGHLSHGWSLPTKKVTLTSKIWDIQFYHVDPKTRVFDYDALEEQAKKTKPKLLISGGTAYPREINHKRMGEIARAVGAYYLADIAHEAGLVAAGVNTSPFPHAHVVTMTTHKTLRGPRGAIIFGRANIMPQIDSMVFPGLQGGPHNHTIAGIAVALHEAATPEFQVYAKQVIANAKVLVDEFIKAGFDVVSDGTDKHLVLLDLRSVKTSAWVAGWALEYAGIVANRNTVPFDTASPVYPSGLRMGTPAITTRGMKEGEMHQIAAWIIQVLRDVAHYELPAEKQERLAFIKTVPGELQKNTTIVSVAKDVKALCKQFPLP